MLDEWTQALLRKYPTATDMDLLMLLFALAVVLWKDTSTVEALHATARRTLHILSTQTSGIDIADLSSRFMLLRARTFMRYRAAGKNVVRNTKRLGVSRATLGRQKQYCPHGGAWRAWVRMHRLGRTGKGDLKELAASFKCEKARGSALYQRAKALGEAARTLGKKKACKTKSPFGDR